MPAFSIVVPIYNVEKYLRGCINSILGQTFSDLELILVDDGSPDGSPEICDQYAKKDPRVRVIHKKNAGVVAARETGVNAASGDYLIFVDGDDWLPLQTLCSYADIIQKYDPDLIVSAHNEGVEGRLTAYASQLRQGFYSRREIRDEIFPMLIEREDGRYFPSSLCAKVYRTEMFRNSQCPLDHRVKIAEDHAITKPYVYGCRSLYITREPLYNYRTNEESVTKKPRPFDWDGPKLVAEHFEKNLPMEEADFKAQVCRCTVHNVFNVAMSQFNQDAPYGEIRQEILSKLQEPCYAEAISGCRYRKYWQGQLAAFCLRKKAVFLIYLIWKLKNRG